MPDGERLIFGFMTGTSIDALDGSAVRVSSRGLDMRATPVHHVSLPLGELAPRLRAFASDAALAARDVAALARDLALLHVDAARELEQASGRPTLLVAHGQTVFHAPPLSLQLFSPTPLAAALNAPVIHDLRAADLALGGQGAPITSLADWLLFRDARETRAVVNLGGFCNVTILPAGGAPDDVRGFDVCACNHVLDEVARRSLRAPYDKDGAAASAGSPHAEAADQLATILTRQAAGGRSLGTGDEAATWIEQWGGAVARPEDLAASAVEGVSQVIVQAIGAHNPDRLIVAGGGAHNRALLSALARHAESPVTLSADLGIPVSHRESVCIALLGGLCEDRAPITLPGVTRVPSPAPLSGCFTPSPRPA